MTDYTPKVWKQGHLLLFAMFYDIGAVDVLADILNEYIAGEISQAQHLRHISVPHIC